MSFNCGIIGLPNAGKSTIFNALSSAGAQIANYPFCTIEPNRGITVVPDERLLKIAEILKKNDPIPTKIEFIDVAGLVEGAAKGEGLGNKFLGHIRGVDALIHVVRCFSGDDVVHVTGEVNPVRDIEIINTELMLADLDILLRAKEKIQKLAQSGDKEAKTRLSLLVKCAAHLNEGKPLKSMELTDEDNLLLKEYGLITQKPVLYLANTGEDESDKNNVKDLQDYARRDASESLCISGKIEEEISRLPDGEKQEYLLAMGLKESGLERLIKAAYSLLDLITYYTSATELQAWTIKRGASAQKAAGKIHTDFERGFIRAEVYAFNDLIQGGSEHNVKETGRLRIEGREYIVQDGDIIKYLFNV